MPRRHFNLIERCPSGRIPIRTNYVDFAQPTHRLTDDVAVGPQVTRTGWLIQLVLFANTEPLIPQKLSVSLRIGGVRSRTDCSALGTRHNDKPPMLIAQRCDGQIRVRTERTRPQCLAFVTLFVLSCFRHLRSSFPEEWSHQRGSAPVAGWSIACVFILKRLVARRSK